MATDEERELMQELLGGGLSEKEIEEFMNMTVARNPVGVKLSMLRYCRKSLVMQSLFVVIVLLILVTLGLSYWTWWVAFIPLLLALVVGFLTILILRNAKEKYEKGLLVPAIVTSIKPTKILVLANMSKGGHSEDEPYETHFGLKLVRTISLDPHPVGIGTVIPCAAVFHEGQDPDCWADCDPEPVCWGTARVEVLNECCGRLDHEDIENLKKLFADKKYPQESQGPAVLVKDILGQPRQGPPPMPQ